LAYDGTNAAVVVVSDLNDDERGTFRGGVVKLVVDFVLVVPLLFGLQVQQTYDSQRTRTK